MELPVWIGSLTYLARMGLEYVNLYYPVGMSALPVTKDVASYLPSCFA